jgi:5'-3' exonuclease
MDQNADESVDMNGIVHPCTHPEGKPAPETEEEMMAEVFKYTERVVNMARPRKVLMMAIGTLLYATERLMANG